MSAHGRARDAVKTDDEGEVHGVSMEPMQSTSACIPKWPDVQARFPLLRPRGLLATASGVAVTAAVSARHHLGAWPRNRRCLPYGLTHLSEVDVDVTLTVPLQRQRTPESAPKRDDRVIAPRLPVPPGGLEALKAGKRCRILIAVAVTRGNHRDGTG